jgi:hypothetical protein|tara:strand:+ start:592 stop:927 length:336 start_codon:yes stop_codon:yes gene_type:complete
MPKAMPKNLKIPPQLLPPVQQKDLTSQMKQMNINKPHLTIRKPTEVKTDIDRQIQSINKRMKGRRANVNDVMKQLRTMNVKVTEQKTDKKGGKKTRRKRKRKRKKTKRRKR